MAFTYSDLQAEVKRRAVRDQGGTQFDTAVKNIINTSLFRISREAPWRLMRRKDTFETVTSYTTGSGGGTFTNGSKAITMVGATFLTDNIQPGRRITLQGSNKDFTIKTITGETTLNIDINYDGTTISGTGTYEILPQEEYLLPVQAGHRMFMWHEDYGYPQQMNFVTEQAFYASGYNNMDTGTPLVYRMWGEDMVREQIKTPGVVALSSSATADTSMTVTVFGTVSGYPDYEIITTNASDGTTAVNGTKTFSKIERVVKSASSTGRLTLTADSANTTIAVIPAGDVTSGVLYKKVQINPLPDAVFPMNIQYYKDPYRLVNDGDVHELGQEFDESLILLSVAKIKYENNQGEADKWYALYQDEIRSLKKTNMDKMDWFPKLRRAFSRSLGAPHDYLNYNQIGPDFGQKVR